MKKLIIASMIMFLAACSGGGGSSSPGPAAPPTSGGGGDETPQPVMRSVSIGYDVFSVRHSVKVATEIAGLFDKELSNTTQSVSISVEDQKILTFSYDQSSFDVPANYQVDFSVDSTVLAGNSVLIDADKTVYVHVSCINGTQPSADNLSCELPVPPQPPPRLAFTGCYTETGVAGASDHTCFTKQLTLAFNLTDQEATTIQSGQVVGAVFDYRCSDITPGTSAINNNIDNPVTSQQFTKNLDSMDYSEGWHVNMAYVLYYPDSINARNIQSVVSCLDLGSITFDYQSPISQGPTTLANYDINAGMGGNGIVSATNAHLSVNYQYYDTAGAIAGSKVEIYDGATLVGQAEETNTIGSIYVNTFLSPIDSSTNRSLTVNLYVYDKAGNAASETLQTRFIGAPESITSVTISGTPSNRINNNGQDLIIHGTNFIQQFDNISSGSKVILVDTNNNEISCSNTYYNSTTEIGCQHDFASIKPPVGIESWSVVVENMYTQERTNAGSFFIGN